VGPILLKNLPELYHLDMSFNKIEELPRGFFEYNQKLEVLMLNNNKFYKIPTDIFKPLKDLMRVDISGNGLLEVSSSLWNSNTRLKEISFDQGNEKVTIVS
jgi:Leucine-rich repeat (LRR) protein